MQVAPDEKPYIIHKFSYTVWIPVIYPVTKSGALLFDTYSSWSYLYKQYLLNIEQKINSVYCKKTIVITCEEFSVDFDLIQEKPYPAFNIVYSTK